MSETKPETQPQGNPEEEVFEAVEVPEPTKIGKAEAAEPTVVEKNPKIRLQKELRARAEESFQKLIDDKKVDTRQHYISSHTENAVQQRWNEGYNALINNPNLPKKQKKQIEGWISGTNEHPVLSSNQVRDMLVAGYTFEDIKDVKSVFFTGKVKSKFSEKPLTDEEFLDLVRPKIKQAQDRLWQEETSKQVLRWEEIKARYINDTVISQMQKIEDLQTAKIEAKKQASEKKVEMPEGKEKEEMVERLAGLWQSTYELDKASKKKNLKNFEYKRRRKSGVGTDIFKGEDARHVMEFDRDRITKDMAEIAGKLSGKDLWGESAKKMEEKGWGEEERQKYLRGQMKKVLEKNGKKIEVVKTQPKEVVLPPEESVTDEAVPEPEPVVETPINEEFKLTPLPEEPVAKPEQEVASPSSAEDFTEEEIRDFLEGPMRGPVAEAPKAETQEKWKPNTLEEQQNLLAKVVEQTQRARMEKRISDATNFDELFEVLDDLKEVKANDGAIWKASEIKNAINHIREDVNNGKDYNTAFEYSISITGSLRDKAMDLLKKEVEVRPPKKPWWKLWK